VIKQFFLSVISLVVLSGCIVQDTGPRIIKEIIIKEPTIINNEKVTYIGLEKESCPEVEACPVCPIAEPCPSPKVIYKDYDKVVLGEVEKVYFPAHKLMLDARIDSGAKRSSMHAENIVPFERDGKNWVHFEMLNKKNERIQVKKEVVKTIKVKRHMQKGQERYVVKMRLNISSLSYLVELSLTDRGQYEYPVLVGRNYLKGNAIVDVSKKYTQKPVKENR
jgi:hypothetical protein